MAKVAAAAVQVVMGCMVFTAESFAAAAKRIAALIYRYDC
jgi:hypothetical protein